MYTRLRRLLFRIIAIVALGSSSYLAFHIAKTWPRCTILSDAQAIHFSDDGNLLITGYTGVQIGNILQNGEGRPPVKVWDTRSGEVTRSLFKDVKSFHCYGICAARNLVVIDLVGGMLRVGDWLTGEEWDLVVAPENVKWFTFAPRGESLLVNIETADQCTVMIDMRERKVSKRFEHIDYRGGFSKDGARYFVSFNDRLHVWNCNKREVEKTLPLGQFENDEKLFIRRLTDEGCFVICDCASLAELSRVRPASPFDIEKVKSAESQQLIRKTVMESRDFVLSPSGRWIATYALPWGGFNGALEIWETATGRSVAAFPSLQRGWPWFSDDDSLIFFDRSHTPLDPVAIANARTSFIETATLIDPGGSIRWRRPARFGKLHPLGNDTWVHVSHEGEWEFIDAMTGDLRHSLPHPFVDEAFMVSFTNDKRLMLAYGRRRSSPVPAFLHKWLARWTAVESGAVQILDAQRERIIFEMNTGVDKGAVLSDDGTTLVSYDLGGGLGFGAFGRAIPAQPMYEFRFYGLHNNSAWYWAIAAPSTLIGIALLWRRWRSRSGVIASNSPSPAANHGL